MATLTLQTTGNNPFYCQGVHALAEEATQSNGNVEPELCLLHDEMNELTEQIFFCTWIEQVLTRDAIKTYALQRAQNIASK